MKRANRGVTWWLGRLVRFLAGFAGTLAFLLLYWPIDARFLSQGQPLSSILMVGSSLGAGSASAIYGGRFWTAFIASQ